MTYEDELKIYYLFTLIDGKATEDENVKFRELCNSKAFGNYDHEKIIAECKELLGNNYETPGEYTILDKIAGIMKWDGWYSRWNIRSDERQRIIWNLISLAYTDNQFSDVERKAIELWAEKFKISDEVYNYMLDTAQTMYDIEKQKNKIKSSPKPYDEIHKQMEKSDQRIQELYDSVETLLKLAAL